MTEITKDTPTEFRFRSRTATTNEARAFLRKHRPGWTISEVASGPDGVVTWTALPTVKPMGEWK